MNPIRERVKTNVPAVVLALLGIIQAFAIELLWSFLVAEPAIYQFSFATLITWLQILLGLLGMLMIWLVYAMNVARFVWVPTASEFVTPFWVGFLQFFSVYSLELENPGLRFICFALIRGSMNWIAHSTMRRARIEPENAAFFQGRHKATRHDFYPAIAAIAAMTATGLGCLVFGVNQWVVLLVLVVVVGGYCIWQTARLRAWWQLSVAPAQ